MLTASDAVRLLAQSEDMRVCRWLKEDEPRDWPKLEARKLTHPLDLSRCSVRAIGLASLGFNLGCKHLDVCALTVGTSGQHIKEISQFQ